MMIRAFAFFGKIPKILCFLFRKRVVFGGERMKKIFVVFALFCALIFVVGCGSDSKPDNNSVTNFGKLGRECYPNKTCDEGLICDTDNGFCIEDTENKTNDSENGDTTPDNGDTEPDEGDSQPDDADTTPDEGDSQPDDADTTPDEGDSQPDEGDSQSDDDADSAPELTEAEKCGPAGGTWNADKETCTKVTDCTGKPANAEWNGAYAYRQTYTNGVWSAEIPTEYNPEERGVCHYKCAKDSIWNPPACIKLPPCGKNSDILCYDSENDLIWSAAYGRRPWDEARDHCENDPNNIGSGWRLPTISELRTLVKNCPATQMPPVEGVDSCGVRDDSSVTCLANSCQDANCYSCPNDHEGGYSKFGDNDCLWASEFLSGSGGLVWVVQFGYGAAVYSMGINSYCNVRCVRNED